MISLGIRRIDQGFLLISFWILLNYTLNYFYFKVKLTKANERASKKNSGSSKNPNIHVRKASLQHLTSNEFDDECDELNLKLTKNIKSLFNNTNNNNNNSSAGKKRFDSSRLSNLPIIQSLTNINKLSDATTSHAEKFSNTSNNTTKSSSKPFIVSKNKKAYLSLFKIHVYLKI